LILNGPRLLISPARAWSATVGDRGRRPGWLMAGALTAALLPAAAVVSGHLGAAALGYETREVAVQRAAVGLVATVGGALVMVPALTLLLMWLARTSRAAGGDALSGPTALGIIWPAWAAGVVLAVPPLLDLGPEPGELLWLLIAVVVALRAIRSGAAIGLGIRRRWHWHFALRTALAFVLLFAVVPLGPALIVRGMLGVEGRPTIGDPEPLEWPVPPEPDW
jgi:hypothetical protein